jgi:serine/threonine-protein kinase HipA
MTENNRSHFMTKRFDRQNNQKIHMQTLCGIAHFDYNMPRAYSYEQAFQIMRQMKLPHSDMEELYRRMVFNVMSRNQDDHTKNISFLMFPNGEWQLSPAYDVTYAYNPDNFWLKVHQMSVNGKRENILLEDLLAVAKNINLKKPKPIIELCTEVLSNWRDYAVKAGIENVQIEQIDKQIILYKM